MKEWQRKQMALMFGPNADESSTIVASQIALQNMPKRLYKYRAPSINSLASLDKGYVIASRLDTFNDIFEAPIIIPEETMVNWLCQTNPGTYSARVSTYKELTSFWVDNFIQNSNVKIAERDLKEIKRDCHTRYMKVVEEKREKIVTEIQQYYNVFCLSERFDNELMWAHYADDHKGFCIEYDMSCNEGNCRVLRELTLPVCYAYNKYVAVNDFNMSPEEYGRLSMKASVLKSAAWEYEHEWRTFFRSTGKHQKEEFMPISAVYLGSRIEESTESLIIDICKPNNIPVYKMNPSVQRHKLFARKIKIK